MGDERVRLRSLLGASTALWAGATDVVPTGWDAISGAPSLEYNVVMRHGERTASTGRQALLDTGRPGLLMIGGPALGDVADLVDAGWTCVTAVPFMSRDLEARPAHGADPATHRPITAEEGAAARRVVAEVFDIGPDLADVAFGDRALAEPGRSAWGAFDPGTGDLLSCLALVRVEEAVCVWSMATARAARRRGHGARLLETALAAAATDGARISLLHASPDGTPFYAALGYDALEYWQVWSRPRWLFGRA